MMSDKQNLSLIKQYREHLIKIGAEQPVRIDPDLSNPTRQAILNHFLYMLSQMEIFIKEGRREKFFRWLGFLQGGLWMLGEFSLSDLRSHNRSSEIGDDKLVFFLNKRR